MSVLTGVLVWEWGCWGPSPLLSSDKTWQFPPSQAKLEFLATQLAPFPHPMCSHMEGAPGLGPHTHVSCRGAAEAGEAKTHHILLQ